MFRPRDAAGKFQSWSAYQSSKFGTPTFGIGGGGVAVPLRLDAGPFFRGLKSSQTALKVFQSGVNQILGGIQRSFGMLTKLVNPLTIALGVGGLAGALGTAVHAYESFNRSMTKSLSIMGDVSSHMQGQMRQAAIDVAKTTMFSASQAADAYFYLASAGLNAEQALASMPAVASFAQAGMFDLATATNMLADSQSALGLRSTDAEENLRNMVRVSDVLTKANIIANAEVEQFAAALTNNAAGALRLVNKDVEEGVAVLAAYADQGIKGEEAGTALGIVMRDLQTKALKFSDRFRQAGVEVFNSSGKMNSMADIIADLETKLAGLSDAQKKQSLIQLGFADRSVAFLQTLIGTSDRIREYEKQLRDATGATAQLAEKIQTPLQKALNQIKGSFQQAAEAMAPFITGTANFLSGSAALAEAQMYASSQGWNLNDIQLRGGLLGISTELASRKKAFMSDSLRSFAEQGRTPQEIAKFLMDDPGSSKSSAFAGYMELLRSSLSKAEFEKFIIGSAMKGNLEPGKWMAQTIQSEGAASLPGVKRGLMDRITGGIASAAGGIGSGINLIGNLASRPGAEVKQQQKEERKKWANLFKTDVAKGIAAGFGGTSIQGKASNARDFAQRALGGLGLGMSQWNKMVAMMPFWKAQKDVEAFEKKQEAIRKGVGTLGTGNGSLVALEKGTREEIAQRVRSSRAGDLAQLARQTLTVENKSEGHLAEIKRKLTTSGVVLAEAALG